MSAIADILLRFIRPLLNLKRREIQVIFFCMGGATLFWFFNALNKSYFTRIKYPIEIQYDTSSLMPVKPLPEFVFLDVKAYGWNLFRKYVGIYNDPIVINPTGLPAKNYILSSDIRFIIGDKFDNLTIFDVVTDTLFIHFDRKVAKTITIVADTNNLEYDEGLKIKETPLVSPNVIHITGPKTMLDTLPEVKTVFLKKLEREGSYIFEMKTLTFFPESVAVAEPRVKIEYTVEKRPLPVIPESVDSLPADTIIKKEK